MENKVGKKGCNEQGIISNDGCMENCIKLRINTGDKMLQTKKDNSIAGAYENKFIIPLDFEMLDSALPYYQAGLRNRLCYEITFNDYNRVIKFSVASPDAKYEISNISLEYEIVTHSTLASSIKAEYNNEMVLLYNRILRHRQISVNKSDTTWNWSFNMPCKSFKGILVLFEEEKPYAQDTSKFYNPKIQKVSVIVGGKPNQLYAQWMRSFEQYDETRKYFVEGKQKDDNANEFQKHLQLHDLGVGEYLTDKYENSLHGMGRKYKRHQKESPYRLRRKEKWQCLHLPNHGCSVEHQRWRIRFCVVLD